MAAKCLDVSPILAIVRMWAGDCVAGAGLISSMSFIVVGELLGHSLYNDHRGFGKIWISRFK